MKTKATKRFITKRVYAASNDFTIRHGNCLRFLKELPDESAQLVITSPPYNVGKEYEQRRSFGEYIEFQSQVIDECVRITKQGGSICWQLGNQFDRRGALVPLDLALHPIFCHHRQLYLRNRIIWHFEHGLHCANRFSGRYETILWYTKGAEYFFNLDAVRIPQKYPGKRSHKGARRGQPSGNPLGKNPSDVWDLPNLKQYHVEKTSHPCQFPIALPETFILALTKPRDLVVDPFLGAGTTAVAALKNRRRAAGAEVQSEYRRIIMERVRQLECGELPYRPRGKPIHTPAPNTKLTTPPDGFFLGNGRH